MSPGMGGLPSSGGREILVTGATGFTGGALALELVRRGHRVRALVREDSDTGRLRDAGVELYPGDIRDPEAVARAVAGTHLVYHIAAVFRTAGHSDSYYREVNAGGVENVIRAARKHRPSRVVHCSTVGVHGHVERIPADEDAPFNPGDIYQKTKAEGEEIARDAFVQDVPGVVFRPAGIFGPGDLRFLKLFRSIQKRRFVMFGTGETLYHFTYIDDLVDGIILCGEHPEALGETFILGGDEYVSLNQLVGHVAEAVGVSPPRLRLPFFPLLLASIACEAACRPLGIDPPLHRRRAEFFVKDRGFSSGKARRILGYAPGVSVREGVRNTARWYFREGHLEGIAPPSLAGKTEFAGGAE